MYFSARHGAPTIDAIGHIGRDLKLFGGVDARAATSTPDGIGAGLGIESFPSSLMLNRAVVLDVARQAPEAPTRRSRPASRSPPATSRTR